MEWKSGGVSGVGPGGGGRGGEERKCMEGGIGQVGSYGGGGHAIGRSNCGQSSGFLPPQSACVNGAQGFGGQFSRNPFVSGQNVGRNVGTTFGLGLTSPTGGGMHVGGDGGLGFGLYGTGGLGFGSFGRGGFGFSSFGGSNSGQGTRSGLSGSHNRLVMDPSNGVLSGNFGSSSVNGGLVRCCCRGGKCMNSGAVAQKPLGETFGRGGVGDDKTRNLKNGGEQLERSKGSDSKKKILGSETAVRKRGRPFGSKTKKKIVDCETNAGKKKVLGSETAVVTESEGPGSKKKVLDSGTSEVSKFVEASAGKELKRKRGRPFGSKTKKKNVDGKTTVAVGSVGGQPGDINEILGGANDKVVDGGCTDGTGLGGEVEGKVGEKLGDGETHAGEKKKVLGSESAVVTESKGSASKKKVLGSGTSEFSEFVEASAGKELKKKPGRPNGSKTKKKIVDGKTIVAVGSVGGQPGDINEILGGANDNIVDGGCTDGTGSGGEVEGNVGKKLGGAKKKNADGLVEGPGESGERKDGNNIKRKPGRPKGSKSKTNISNGKTKLVAALGEGKEGNHVDKRPMNEDDIVDLTTSTPSPVESQEGNEFKRKVGRPRVSKRKIMDGGGTVNIRSIKGQEGNQLEKKTPDGEVGQTGTGVDRSVPLKRKQGQPVGSGRRIHNVDKRYYIDVESFR